MEFPEKPPVTLYNRPGEPVPDGWLHSAPGLDTGYSVYLRFLGTIHPELKNQVSSAGTAIDSHVFSLHINILHRPRFPLQPVIMAQLVSTRTVLQHNRPEDCWIVIDNQVWDVTSFVPQHPGGANGAHLTLRS